MFTAVISIHELSIAVMVKQTQLYMICVGTIRLNSSTTLFISATFLLTRNIQDCILRFYAFEIKGSLPATPFGTPFKVSKYLINIKRE